MIKNIFSLLLFLIVFNSYSQTNLKYSLTDSAIKVRILKDISILSSDSFIGREAGTIGEKYARKYIKTVFEEIGLKPINNNSYYQIFYIGDKDINNSNDSLYKISDSAYNVIGFLNNNAEKTIVIGAHYDHLGKTKSYIYNGADDNASGTALIIELARELSQIKNINCNFIFIAFSAEEKGLLGSYYFTQSDLFTKYKPYCYINFDMVGRAGILGKNKIVIMGIGSSNEWTKILKNIKPDGLRIKKFQAAPAFSDHQPFYEKQIPYVYFTTGLHPQYHTTQDDIEYINLNGIKKIIDYTLNLIRETDKKTTMEFRKTSEFQIIRTIIFFMQMM